MTSDDPHGVVTLSGDGDVGQVLRRAVGEIERLGLVVLAVIDHSGEAAEVGLTMPEAKLVIFGNPRRETELMLAHPDIALDLPLKLLICESNDGRLSVSYNSPGYLAHRFGLTDREVDVLRVVETIAGATASERPPA